ncbi:hypothetical protein [Aerococcus christensenii]|uniref:hypothetical protein n=1 Tax=Aerococcus christensenii TaxID=87541 RepID=UPI003F43BB71
MDKGKWLGTWSLTDEEKEDGRHVKGEFNAGIIPSVVVIGLLAYGIIKLVF